MIVERNIFQKLVSEFNKKEISILIGPRQVGKTFLLKRLEDRAKQLGLKYKYFNLEIPGDIIQFHKNDPDLFDFITEGIKLLFIDEFHYLKNASKLFKAVYDSNKNVKIFASGSSSIQIHKHLKESLAGRRLISKITPLLFGELQRLENKKLYSNYLVFGGLPGLLNCKSEDQKINLLQDILETYIQKDVKSLIKEENIRAFNVLLYLLAENQGSLVSVNNLAREVGLSSKSINHYLSILEHTYIVFPVHSFSKNLGNELKKSTKYYFYDTGIRNIILKDFSDLDNRDDAGVLHETFIFLHIFYHLKPNMELKFWRTKQGNEIDFILLKNRKPFLIEVKKKITESVIPQAIKLFIKKYPETSGAIIFSDIDREPLIYNGVKINFYSHKNVVRFISEWIK